MEWYYVDDNNEAVGPISETTLSELRSCGVLKADSNVCPDGAKEWMPYAQAFPKLPASEPTIEGGANAGSSSATRSAPAPLPNQMAGGAGKPVSSARPVQPPPAVRDPSSKNRKMVPIMIGCGGLMALMVIIGIVAAIGAAFSNGGGNAGMSENRSSERRNYSSPCGRCGGSGQLVGQCTKCYGAGTIMSRGANYDGIQPYSQPVQMPCPQCRGGGQMPVPCNRCRGSGQSR